MSKRFPCPLLVPFAVVLAALSPWYKAAAEPDHPRLFFSSEELARLRTLAKDEAVGPLGIAPKSLYQDILRRAEACKTNPFKRSTDEYVLRTVQSRLYDLTLVYAVSDDLDLLVALLRDVSEICGMGSWGDMSGAFGMLGTGTGIAFAYDVLHPVLDETEETDLESHLKRHGLEKRYAALHKKQESVFDKPEAEDKDELEGVGVPDNVLEKMKPEPWKVRSRTAIRQALVRNVVTPLYGPAKKGDFCALSNIHIFQLSSLGVIALALQGEKDCPEASAWLETAENGLRKILDLSDADGGWIEGLGYGSMAFDKLIIFADALKRVTGRSLMTHPALRNVAQFAMHTASPDGNYGVGFGDTWGYPGFGLCCLRLAKEFHDPEVMWHLKNVQYPVRGAEDIHPFLFYHADVAPRPPEALVPKGRLFRGIGWVTFRAAWDDPDALFLALKSGPDGYHTQNDQNHFELYGYRAYLSTDHGYTHRRAWRGGTIGHNGLLIDGQGQCCGWVDNRSGRVLEFLSAPAFGYVKANANSYGTQEPLLDWFYRRVHFTPPGYVVVFDDVKTRNDVPRQSTFLLHITREHSRPQKGEIEIGTDEAYLIPEDSRAYLRAFFCHPPGCRYQNPMYYDRANDELTGPYLAADTPEKAARQRFVTVLYPQRVTQAGAAPDKAEISRLAVENGLLVRVRTAGGEDLHLFRFADSGQVAGAEVACNGSSALLSRTAEGNFTRFALCEGTSLTSAGRVLVQSTSPVVAAFSNWSEYEVRNGVRTPRIEADRLLGTVSLSEDARFQVWCPAKPVEIRLDGNRADSAGFDEKAALCAFELPQGSHTLEMRFAR